MNIGKANTLQAKRSEMQHAIRHAAEQIGYWTMRKAEAIRPVDKAEAGARLLAWESNRRCKQAELETLNGRAAA